MLLESTRRVLWQAFERLRDPMPVVGWVAVVAREVRGSRDELIWPEKLVCGHPERY